MNDPAADLLDRAKNIVTGARRASYGKPEDNFACIAALWQTYLDRRTSAGKLGVFEITPADVAVMMVLMKTARLAETPGHEDSWQDIAGYAACGWRCAAPAAPPPVGRDTPRPPAVTLTEQAEAMLRQQHQEQQSAGDAGRTMEALRMLHLPRHVLSVAQMCLDGGIPFELKGGAVIPHPELKP